MNQLSPAPPAATRRLQMCAPATVPGGTSRYLPRGAALEAIDVHLAASTHSRRNALSHSRLNATDAAAGGRWRWCQAGNCSEGSEGTVPPPARLAARAPWSGSRPQSPLLLPVRRRCLAVVSFPGSVRTSQWRVCRAVLPQCGRGAQRSENNLRRT